VPVESLESDSLEQTNDAHRIRATATQSLPSWLCACKHAFRISPPSSRRDIIPSKSSQYAQYLNIDFSHIYHTSVNCHSIAKRFQGGRVGCTSAGGHMQQHLFSLRIAPSAPVELAPGCRTSFNPGSWPKLAPSPISRSLASA
jgi:hypothetical protein